MNIWKERPGLEETLMRTINRRYWYDNNYIEFLHQKNLQKRYEFWITTDEAKISAANAIREYFLNLFKKKENCYKKLAFVKINLDYDLIQEVCRYLNQYHSSICCTTTQ